MPDDDDIAKNSVEIERLERLEGLAVRYAQSRVLPLLIPLAIMLLNVILLLFAGKAAELLIFHLQICEYWFEVIVVGAVVWVVLLCPWVTGKITAKYGDWPYRKEGIIELEEEKIPEEAIHDHVILMLIDVDLNKSERRKLTRNAEQAVQAALAKVWW